MLVFTCNTCDTDYDATISPLGISYYIDRDEGTKMIKIKLKDEKEECIFCKEAQLKKEKESDETNLTGSF